MKNKYFSFILHVKKGGKVVKRYDTRKYNRFMYYTRLILKDKWDFQVYLKVNYAEFIKGIRAFNSGTYENKKDFQLALSAFLE